MTKNEEWNDLINTNATISSFCGCFPERQIEFQVLIVPLIKLVADKTDLVRKNAAVLLARLSENPDNKRVMQENHGTEVLTSLEKQLVGSR